MREKKQQLWNPLSHPLQFFRFLFPTQTHLISLFLPLFPSLNRSPFVSQSLPLFALCLSMEVSAVPMGKADKIPNDVSKLSALSKSPSPYDELCQ